MFASYFAPNMNWQSFGCLSLDMLTLVLLAPFNDFVEDACLDVLHRELAGEARVFLEAQVPVHGIEGMRKPEDFDVDGDLLAVTGDAHDLRRDGGGRRSSVVGRHDERSCRRKKRCDEQR